MSSDNNEPVHLVEDEATGDRFLVYGSEKGMRLDVRYEGETLWMTQAQIAGLFGRERSVITRHINNVFEEGELDEGSNVQKMHIATSAKPVSIYNLDVIISVGYRVSSAQATNFRRWATGILVQFAKQGFVVDSVRLKQPDNLDHIRELREIIRDLRSEEANLYQELTSICAMCQDYDGKSKTSQEFFRRTQAKFINAVTSNTPSEIVYARADASVENMGLQTWPHNNIRKTDVMVSKNYLAQAEIKELNRLTSILLDIFEDQMELGRLTTISDVKKMLNERLKDLGRSVLQGGGNVKTNAAKKKAHGEFEKFNTKRKLEQRAKTESSYQELARKAKSLPKTRR